VEACDAPAMPASELLRWAQEDAMRISSSRPLTQSRVTAQGNAGEGVQVIAESDTRGTGAYDGTFWMRAFVDGIWVYTVMRRIMLQPPAHHTQQRAGRKLGDHVIGDARVILRMLRILGIQALQSRFRNAGEQARRVVGKRDCARLRQRGLIDRTGAARPNG
jgi:hypothetical protein